MVFVDTVRWSLRGKDAGSPDSGAIGATEDAASRRPAERDGTTTISPNPPRRAGAALAVLALGLAIATSAGAFGPAAVAPPSGSVLAALALPGQDSSLASDRIYFVMTDRYANGDPSNDTGGVPGTRNINGFDPTSPAWWHGGDFNGLTGGCTDPVRGVQRIKNLGFN